jgi:hypothetical protein
MMRQVVNKAMDDVTTMLNDIGLPGCTLKITDIKDCEDKAVGAGIMSKNAALFPIQQQVAWPASQIVHIYICRINQTWHDQPVIEL